MFRFYPLIIFIYLFNAVELAALGTTTEPTQLPVKRTKSDDSTTETTPLPVKGTKSADSIVCYDCNSFSDENCGEHLKWNDRYFIKTVYCSNDCFIWTLHYGGRTEYVRGCSSGTHKVDKELCSNSRCNREIQLYSNTLTLLLNFVMVFLLSK